MLDRLDPLVQRLRRVAREHGHALLRNFLTPQAAAGPAHEPWPDLTPADPGSQW